MRGYIFVIFSVVTFSSAHSQLVKLSGYRLFLDCNGTAQGKTVVMIAGGGGTTEAWSKVQQPISQFARVCTYDRLGLGQSDTLPSARDQNVTEIVQDLEELLKRARVEPPYILVGHSIGGIYARAFDEHYDAQVAGMILIDSSHEEQIWRFAQKEPEALTEYPRWLDQGYMSSQGFLPSGQRLRWKFSKPLVVIEHGIPPEPVWHEMQRDLASRSPQSLFITAIKSSHYIQTLQPELVIDAVRRVVEGSDKFTKADKHQ